MAELSSGFGVYVHVPFCQSRCGYCDFNTYTPGELGTSASPQSFMDALERELELAARTLAVPAQTVFVGGGTPSIVGHEGLAQVLRAVRNSVGLAADAEVTTEANPESTNPEFFTGLLEAGYSRVSLGMQSVSRGVLQVLQRRHTPGRAVAAAHEARKAGFMHVNLDMIYGTPTEEDDDVRATVEAVLSTEVDHVSAYSLVVEDGTAMARKVRKGELPAPDEDVMARRYEIIDSALVQAGMQWYEVSNWASSGGECLHNQLYWQDGNWWGAGPGAHSHIDNRRWFNVKHPARYATMLEQNTLPIAGEEELSDDNRHTEKIMLGLRTRRGIPVDWVRSGGRRVVDKQIHDGMLVIDPHTGRLRVTDKGRLFADGIVADILVAEEECIRR